MNSHFRSTRRALASLVCGLILCSLFAAAVPLAAQTKAAPGDARFLARAKRVLRQTPLIVLLHVLLIRSPYHITILATKYHLKDKITLDYIHSFLRVGIIEKHLEFN